MMRRINVQLQPIGKNNTKDIQCKFNRNKLASRGVFSRLRGPDWNDGVQDSGADSVDKPGYRVLALNSCCW
jgi:hypothetical protein